MSARPDVDVVVIGAGPAGNVCAAHLAHAGLSVLVLEEHAAAGDFVNCTGIIGVEAFELCELPREPILASLSTLTFIGPSGRRCRYDPGEPLAHIVSRKRFDSALAALAEAAGARYRYGVRARTVAVDADGVSIGFGDGLDPVRAQAAGIAPGFGTNLPQQVGLAGPTRLIYGAQAEVPMRDLHDTEIYLGRAIAPDSFAWVAPIGPNLARVGLTVPQHAPYHFEQFMRSAAIAPRLVSPRWTMKLSPVPVGMMPRSYTDRVLVVGEAAGQVKTTTQGGIYYGILGGMMAAVVLEKASAHGVWSAAVLRDYERQWHRKLAPELKMGEHLRALFARLSDDQIDAIVELGTRADVVDLVRRIAKFDWHRELIASSLKLPLLQELVRLGRF